MDYIHWTYFYGIRQMGMKVRSLIEISNLRLSGLTATAIHHCLSAWNTDEFRVLPEFGLGGVAQHKCKTRNIELAVNDANTVVVRPLKADFCCSSPEGQANEIDNICSMICQRIHSPGMDPVIAQRHNDQSSLDNDCLDYILEDLIEQPDNSFNRLSSFVATTEATSQTREIIIAMMHNPPMVVEQLLGTERSCINKFNLVNHFCLETFIGQIKT